MRAKYDPGTKEFVIWHESEGGGFELRSRGTDSLWNLIEIPLYGGIPRDCGEFPSLRAAYQEAISRT